MEDQTIQKIIAIEESRGNKVNHFFICTMSFDYSSYDTETNLPNINTTRTRRRLFPNN